MTKCCLCGEPIWVDYRFNGYVWVAAYYDDNCERITHCPGCGEWLCAEELVVEGELEV